MSKKLRWGLGVVAAMFIVATAVRADDDVSSLKAELADLKAKVAAMESSEMAPAAGGDAESLTSMKKKGAIKIGGNFEVGLIVKDRDENPLAINQENDSIQSTEFTTYDADLNFDIAASKDMGLYIKLDLDDFWNEGNVQQDDLLEEVYFYWKNIGGRPFQMNFGKKEVPFGMDQTVVFLYPYTHGQAGGRTSLFAPTEAAVANAENTYTQNSHARVGYAAQWAGEIDNVFQVEGIYTYKDLLKFYGSVFQSRQTTGGGRATRGMYEDRSDDNMLFQSFALKVEFTPLEALKMELSFVNEHCASYDEGNDNILNEHPLADAAGTYQGARYGEEDTQAISFGVSYKFKVPVTLYGEYIHQWDWAFDDRGDADIVSLGVVWGVTENIDLGFGFDYANIDMDEDDMSAAEQTWLYEDQDFYAASIAATYKFDNGIAATLTYRHEWFDGDLAGINTNPDNYDADADAIGFVMSWNF